MGKERLQASDLRLQQYLRQEDSVQGVEPESIRVLKGSEVFIFTGRRPYPVLPDRIKPRAKAAWRRVARRERSGRA
jgi:hypothetical protein